jgi:hypothetical protein
MAKNKKQKRKAKLKAKQQNKKQYHEAVQSVHINYEKIKLAFPDVQKRQEYISALCQAF